MMAQTIRAVIFDFDGLLVDSEPAQFAAWETFVASYGKTLPDDLKRRMYGTRLVDSSRMVAGELDLPISPEQVASDRDELFFASIPGNILAKSGALRLLSWFWDRSILTALATSGHRVYVDLACESAGIPRRFDVEVTGDLVQHGKPHPETFLLAAEKLGVQPQESLILEDSPQGVQAAVDAGATCFAIPDSPEERPVDLAHAHLVVPSLDDVLEAASAYGLEFSNSSHG